MPSQEESWTFVTEADLDSPKSENSGVKKRDASCGTSNLLALTDEKSPTKKCDKSVERETTSRVKTRKRRSDALIPSWPMASKMFLFFHSNCHMEALVHSFSLLALIILILFGHIQAARDVENAVSDGLVCANSEYSHLKSDISKFNATQEALELQYRFIHALVSKQPSCYPVTPEVTSSQCPNENPFNPPVSPVDGPLDEEVPTWTVPDEEEGGCPREEPYTSLEAEVMEQRAEMAIWRKEQQDAKRRMDLLTHQLKEQRSEIESRLYHWIAQLDGEVSPQDDSVDLWKLEMTKTLRSMQERVRNFHSFSGHDLKGQLSKWKQELGQATTDLDTKMKDASRKVPKKMTAKELVKWIVGTSRSTENGRDATAMKYGPEPEVKKSRTLTTTVMASPAQKVEHVANIPASKMVLSPAIKAGRSPVLKMLKQNAAKSVKESGAKSAKQSGAKSVKQSGAQTPVPSFANLLKSMGTKKPEHRVEKEVKKTEKKVKKVPKVKQSASQQVEQSGAKKVKKAAKKVATDVKHVETKKMKI